MDTVPPDVIAVELRFRSAPDVLTVPVMMQAEALFNARKCAAVPVSSALVSDVIADAVAVAVVPSSEAAPKAGTLQVRVASRVPVAAASGSAAVPVRISMVAVAASNKFTIASHAAVRAAAASEVAI